MDGMDMSLECHFIIIIGRKSPWKGNNWCWHPIWCLQHRLEWEKRLCWAIRIHLAPDLRLTTNAIFSKFFHNHKKIKVKIFRSTSEKIAEKCKCRHGILNYLSNQTAIRDCNFRPVFDQQTHLINRIFPQYILYIYIPYIVHIHNRYFISSRLRKSSFYRSTSFKWYGYMWE